MQKYSFKTPPMAHQLEALRAGWNQHGFAYLMGTGTGKTKVSIDNIGALYDRGDIQGALIFANKGSYTNWSQKEIPQHMPDRFPTYVYVWDGAHTKRSKEQLDTLNRFPGLRVMVMNIEAISTDGRAMDVAVKFLKETPSIMIVDESTSIKNMSATRTRNAHRLGRYAKYRRIMTGTPITKSPLDAYAPFEFLDPGMLGFKSFYAFRARYSVLKDMEFGGRKFKIPVSYRNLEDLAMRLAPHSFRVLKEDCLDLPPKTYEKYEVQMTDEQAELYEKMKTQATAELLSGTYVTATKVITQILRLHQIVCGHVKDEDGTIHTIKNNRVSSLLQVAEEMDGKVIIWANYLHDVHAIISALVKEYGEDSVVEYTGRVHQIARDTNRRIFQDDPRVRFFVGNQQTGGYGLTLTAANNVIYYSNNYSLELRLQSEDRCHRIGQNWPVTYVDLTTPGTVDEKIIETLRNNKNIADLITGDRARDWL